MVTKEGSEGEDGGEKEEQACGKEWLCFSCIERRIGQ